VNSLKSEIQRLQNGYFCKKALEFTKIERFILKKKTAGRPRRASPGGAGRRLLIF